MVLFVALSWVWLRSHKRDWATCGVVVFLTPVVKGVAEIVAFNGDVLSYGALRLQKSLSVTITTK